MRATLIAVMVIVCGCTTVKRGMQYEYDKDWDTNAQKKVPSLIQDWVESARGDRVLDQKMNSWGNKKINELRGWIIGGLTSIITALGWAGTQLHHSNKNSMVKIAAETLKQNGVNTHGKQA